MRFTIITGPGRCGSSALTQFFINSKKYRVDDSTGFNPSMRAGHESYFTILANSILYSSKQTLAIKDLGIGKIHHLYDTSDIVKSPTFFYLNTYSGWQDALSNGGGIQVILLKRDSNEIFNSVRKIKSKDWDTLTEDKLNQLWEENVNTLKKHSIPYIILEYPKFTKDSNYLYDNLKKLDLGDWKYTPEEITDLMNMTFY